MPLLVTFGADTYKAGVEMSTAEFWERMVAPDAPFPKTAAASPGDFKDAFEAAFEAGAEAIVSISVAGTLSGTIKSAQIARDMLPDREIHVIDSQGASMEQGILARMGVELAADGHPAAEIAERLEARTGDMRIYVALETLEYLKKGGRISGAQAAIGTLLSVKPIIRVKDGVVDTVDQVRTRSKARERLIELITRAPDRAAGDPAHGQPGRRGVPGRGPGARPRAGCGGRRRSAWSGRRSGRTSVPAASARRSCTLDRVDDRRATFRDTGCDKVASCHPVPSGRRGSADAGLYSAPETVARQPSSMVVRPAARPVGSSGRRPEPTAVPRPPDT